MGEASIVSELFLERLNYCIYVILLMIGLWAMLAKRNLIKKLIGMSIFQTAIILFYVSIAVKEEATIPIYLPEHDPHAGHSQAEDDQNVSVSSQNILMARWFWKQELSKDMLILCPMFLCSLLSW